MAETDASVLRNRTFDQLGVGDAASVTRSLTRADLANVARLAGDVDPAHIDRGWMRVHGDGRLLAQELWAGALFSMLIGSRLPGPGSVCRAQRLAFESPVREGDTLTATVVVREKRSDGRTVVLECRCVNQYGDVVAHGDAEVTAPEASVALPRPDLEALSRRETGHFGALLEAAQAIEPMPTAVVHPCSEAALQAVVEAAAGRLIRPILVAPMAKLQALATRLSIDLAPYRIVDVPHSHAAAEAAVALVRAGEAPLLMKGSLHTDELLAAVVSRERGLRTERRLSHVFVMDVPSYPKLLMITDAAINILPGLEDKRDICQNAIDLALALGIERPKVAILSAVETVNPKMPSTTDAAALCKMADRGQIVGGCLDGPLAMDNAISREAAAIKGIRSEVAGDPDVLLVPDLEAGNMLAKQLTFMAGADAAGIVLGARVPIVLTSRADSVRARLASCAVAVLLARARAAALPAALA